MSMDAIDRRRDDWRLQGASPDVDVAPTGHPGPSPSRPLAPDYDQILSYEPPALPVAANAPANGAVAFAHWDDASLSHQVDALSARLRLAVAYPGRGNDQKELGAVEAEVARRRQGPRPAAIESALQGDVAGLARAEGKLASNVERVLGASPGAAAATRRSARDEIIEETEALRVRYERASTDLAQIEEMEPPARAELTKRGVVAQVEATKTALKAQIVRNVEVVQRISVGPVIDEALGAAKAAGAAIEFLHVLDTTSKNRNVTDRQLDALVGEHDAHLAAVKEQLVALKQRQGAAQSVVAQVEAIREGDRSARQSIELAGARRVLDGVLPGDGQDGCISIKQQIEVLSRTAAALCATREKVAHRYDVLAAAVDAQLVSLGGKPTKGIGADGIWAGMKRVADLLGTTAPLPPAKGHFGEVDQLAMSFMRDTTLRKTAMLEKAATILHAGFGIDILPFDGKGEPQVPLLPRTAGSKELPLPDPKAVDAKLAQACSALAVVTGHGSKLQRSDIQILSKAAVHDPRGTPLDPTNDLLTDLTSAHNRMQFVSAEGLADLAALADQRGGTLTAAQLKTLSVDLSALPSARETARALLSNPQFAAALEIPGGQHDIRAASFRRLAPHAGALKIDGHPHALPVSIFYAGAFTDAGRLRGAISGRNPDEAVAVLAKLTQSQRHMLALAYGDSLSQDLQRAFSGADLGRVAYAFERPLPREERLPAVHEAIVRDPSYVDRRIVEVEASLRRYEAGGLTHSLLGLRRSGNAEAELRARVDAVKACRAELARALHGRDPETVAMACTAAAKALVDCLDMYVRVTTEVSAQVAATDRFLLQSQAVATAVTVTAVATAASIGTAGAATPWAGAATATALGAVAGTLAGSAMASIISLEGQAFEKSGRIDWTEVGGAARDGAVMGFAAAVTAGASSLAMDGVMTAVNATRVGVFLQSGSRLAAVSNVAVKSVVTGVASAGSAAVGTVGGAWIRGATGDLAGAKKDLAALEESSIRAGISGALLAPFAGKLSGIRGRAFDGAAAGLDQVVSNKILGREASEGVGQAITSGVVIGTITEKHANTTAAKRIGAAPAEGHPVHLPGENPAKAPSWKIVAVDPASGWITVAPLTSKPAGAVPNRNVGAAALLQANEASLALARPEVDHERVGVMKRVIPDADVRAKLDTELRSAREQRHGMTPEAYKARVETIVGDATTEASALDATGRAAARQRLEALPNAARDPHVQELLSILDAGERPKGAEAQALVALELAGVAETQIKADRARGKNALTPEHTRDAIAGTLTKSGINASEAELAAARRTGAAPRLEKLEGATLRSGELQKTRDAFRAAWTKAPAQHDDLGALARAAGFTEQPPATQRALIEAPAGARAVLAEELARHGGDKVAASTLAQLALSKGFQALGTADQQHLLRYVGGKNAELSAPARAALAHEVNDPSFQRATPREQHDRLQTFMRKQPGIQPVLAEAPGTWTATATARMSAPADVPSIAFSSGAKPAKRYEVMVDGRKISVLASTQAQEAGLHVHTPEDVRRALELMPKQARDLVKVIHLDSGRSSSDAYWQKEYRDPNHRAYMTAAANGVLSIHPTEHAPSIEQMVGTLTHEAGHFDSNARWGLVHTDDPKRGVVADPRWTQWKDAMVGDKFAASTYAKHNPAEDFAESYRLYAQTVGTQRHAELRNIMPDRFRVLDAIWTGRSP